MKKENKTLEETFKEFDKKSKNYGVITSEGIDYHYFVEGSKYGNTLIVYILKESKIGEIEAVNRMTRNFSFRHFEPKEEVEKLIKAKEKREIYEFISKNPTGGGIYRGRSRLF